MKALGFAAVVLVLVLFAFSVFANHNNKTDLGTQMTINDGLETFKEEVCVDGFGNKTCSENTYMKCNGETYKVPAPTGFTVYKDIVKKEYVEKECANDILNDKEKPSPSDRIKDSDLEVFNNKIVIDIKNSNWRKFIDSNSMDPFIDEGTTTIEIKPEDEKEIKIGDIIAYNIDEIDYTLVHRVIDIGKDENGTYFITKGDNYYKEDPYKIRFERIEGIVVGVLY